MNKKALKAAIAHAVEAYPEEACGLLVGGNYVECKNVADDPLRNFHIHHDEYTYHCDNGGVQMIIHSHPDRNPRPTESDLIGCEVSAVPWLIISVHKGEYHDVHTFEPSGYQAPLVGRQFSHGVLDCLSIVLDYYKRELGVDLGAYEREDDWWNKGKNYYLELLPRAGFYQVDGQPKQGDVVLMQIRSPVPNHAGVYLGDSGILTSEPEHYPAPGSILHHMHGRDSTREVYGGYWQEKTVSIWRHDTKA